MTDLVWDFEVDGGNFELARLRVADHQIET